MSTEELTVLELNRSVKDLLHRGFPGEFWIRGVVTGMRQASGRGHTYFQLADPSAPGEQPPAVVDCALFAGDRAAISIETGREGRIFALENNSEVRILAGVNFWERNGRFQIVMKGYDPFFSGDSQAIHLARLVEKLGREGVLAENGTLPFPAVPLTVGLVTAKGTAAMRDFMKTLEESGYPFRVYASSATMQGSDTATSVCEAFNRLLMSGICGTLDAVVLTRGGGSATDLAWFNSEAIARTIAQLPWPVISAIGHETDTTLPDHAAHTRAKTPTHAASLLVDAVAAFDDSVSRQTRALAGAVTPRLRMERMRLDGLVSQARRNLETVPERGLRKLDEIRSRIALAAGNRFRGAERELSALDAAVEVRNPAKMLQLGWAVVRDLGGKPVGNARMISPGDRLRISMKGGEVPVKAEEREK